MFASASNDSPIGVSAVEEIPSPSSSSYSHPDDDDDDDDEGEPGGLTLTCTPLLARYSFR